MFFLSNYVYIRNRWESAFWIYRLNREYEAPRNPPFGLNQQYLMCYMAITVRKKNKLQTNFSRLSGDRSVFRKRVIMEPLIGFLLSSLCRAPNRQDSLKIPRKRCLLKLVEISRGLPERQQTIARSLTRCNRVTILRSMRHNIAVPAGCSEKQHVCFRKQRDLEGVKPETFQVTRKRVRQCL